MDVAQSYKGLPIAAGQCRAVGFVVLPKPEQDLSLLETLDHLLDRGVVVAGEAVISIGDVDLLYLGLNIVLANMDAVIRTGRK